MRDYSSIEMPGRVVSMSTTDEHLFVVCNVVNPFWKFWKPRYEKRLLTFDHNLERVA